MKSYHLAIFLVGLVCAGQSIMCQAFRTVQRSILINRALKLNSFSGVMQETGTSRAGPLEYQVHARRPAFFYSEIITPGEHQGAVSIYNGSTLYVYLPGSKFGYMYENVPAMTIAEQKKHMRDNFDWHFQVYRPRLGRKRKIAGYPATQVQYRRKSSRKFLYDANAWVLEQYSFPLATDIRTSRGRIYSTSWKNVRFNKPVPAENFRFGFPADATVARWDLKSKNYTLSEADAAANFKMNLPAQPPRGLRLQRLIRVAGAVPGFTAVYRKSIYYLYCSMVKDYGVKLFPPRGLELRGRHHYFVNFAGMNTSVYFKTKNVHYTLVSNLPYQQLLSVGEAIPP